MGWRSGRTSSWVRTWLRRGALLVAIASALASASADATPADPVAVSTPPSPRCCAGAAYDTASQSVLVFGGSSIAGALADTNSWNPLGWSPLTPAFSPPPLANVGMVEDGLSGNILLFGGQDPNDAFVNSTYSWNGASWQQLNPTTSPSPRTSPNLAYDAATGQIVLFGGCCAAGSGQELDDTFVWSSGTWTQPSPSFSPPGSESGTMAYDATLNGVVYYGGCCGLSNTYLWQDGNWSQLAINGGPSVGGPMTWDAATQTLLMYQVSGSTWAFDGSSWARQTSTTSPGARTQANLVYDDALGAVLLFGGTSASDGWPLNDLWSWTAAGWSQVNVSADARRQLHR